MDRRRDRRGQPGRPRAYRQGRRRRRVVRGMGPHGRQDHGARPRRHARRPQAHRGGVLHARLPLLPDRRALHSSAFTAQHGRLCAVGGAIQGSAAIIRRPRIEPVEVPYGDTSLPALLVHPDPEATRGRPAPAMVFFDGFDVTKELQYGYGIPDLAARGVGCLIVDGPGNGESVRFRDLPLIAETERYATPVYEYLAGRPEFDAKRIGVMALSLGGYYAPRAGSLEQRFACCVAWGAMWDFHETWRRRFELLDSGKVPSLSVPPKHLEWVLGVEGREAAMKKLEGFRLDGIVQKMTCPFLVMHGEGDEQIPVALAQRLYESSGSKQKTLKVFTREEGGFHHCQVDDVTIGLHFMFDWIADVLDAGN